MVTGELTYGEPQYDAECVEIDQGNTRHQGRALDKGEELSRFEEECQKKAAAWT